MDEPIGVKKHTEPCSVDGCDEIIRASGFCKFHYSRWKQTRDIQKVSKPRSTGYTDSNGYVWVYSEGRKILQHRLRMQEILGRKLLPGENVHHKNGVRGDNRPENLELWSSSQPPGQRVADKVEWAKEILALYEPDSLRVEVARCIMEVSPSKGG